MPSNFIINEFKNIGLLDLEKNLKIILYIYFIKIIDR